MRYSHMHLMVFFNSSVNVSSDKTGGFYSSVQVFMWEMIQWVPLNWYHKILTEKGHSYFFPPWFLGTAVGFAEFLWRRQLCFAFSDEVEECWFWSRSKFELVIFGSGRCSSASLILSRGQQHGILPSRSNLLSPLVLTAASLGFLPSCSLQQVEPFLFHHRCEIYSKFEFRNRKEVC